MKVTDSFGLFTGGIVPTAWPPHITIRATPYGMYMLMDTDTEGRSSVHINTDYLPVIYEIKL